MSGNKAGAPALIVTLAFLLVSTLLQQSANPRYSRFRTADSFGLLPMWSFFAPTPARHDLYILWRFFDVHGRPGEWRQLCDPAAQRWYQILFYPGRRHSKIIFDLVQDLQRSLATGHEKTVTSDGAYVAIKNFARRQAQRERQDETRFQLCAIKDAGFDEEEQPEVMFLSKQYQIDLEGTHGTR